MSFNPNEHMMQLKGKDYLQVAWRLVWFREDHPDWGLNAECLEHDEDHAIFKATITDENGVQKSSGHGSESKKDFGDYLEKAETKAVGRALAMLGYGTQFAADELDEGSRIVDSPVDRQRHTDPAQPMTGTDILKGQPATEEQKLKLIAKATEDQKNTMYQKYGANLSGLSQYAAILLMKKLGCE